MSATAEETDLVQLLQRTFPSLASLPLDEGLRRAEGLGLYTATVWSAGTAGLASRGIAIAPDVHAALSPAAAQIAKEKKGGAAFLARVRASVQEETFAATLVVIANHYARAAAASRASSGSHAALATPDAKPAEPRFPPTRAFSSSAVLTALEAATGPGLAKDTALEESAPAVPPTKEPASSEAPAAAPLAKETASSEPPAAAPLAKETAASEAPAAAPPAKEAAASDATAPSPTSSRPNLVAAPPPSAAPPADGAPAVGEATAALSTGTKSGGFPKVLREIAGFELVKLLGEGGMGKVFKAKQKSLDRAVALKVLSPTLAKDPEYVDRFHREAMAAGALRHPNIVGVIDHGVDPSNGVHFIAFEFVDGMTVGAMLAKKKKLPEREALAIVHAVAAALASAEQAKIVHRDIKPDNIIVGHDGVPRVVDLGLAKKHNDKSAMTIVGVVMGTPQYMSPEQALGETEIDCRADIYALGMTLYKLVTGKVPFDAESSTGILMKHITDDCPDPRTVEPDLSESTTRIILKLAAREKTARYQSSNEVLKDVDLVLAGKPPQIAPPLPGQALAAAAAPPSATGRTKSLGARTSGSMQAVGRSSGAIAALAAAGGEAVVPVEPAWILELKPSAIGDAEVEAAPREGMSPGETALALFLKTGEQEKLAEATRLFEEALEKVQKTPRKAAEAQADLALVELAKGDRSAAEESARAAIEKDARCRGAVSVLARAARGDAERSRLSVLLAVVRRQIAANKLDLAKDAANEAHDEFPFEPHPLLALALVSRLTGHEARFREALAKAWERYPSKERCDVTLSGLDGPVADVLVAHGRTAFQGDGSDLKWTVEGQDEKKNLIAGSLRMAIGIARTALSVGGVQGFQERRLRFAVARALAGLRRYDAGLEELQKVHELGPSSTERVACEAERFFIYRARDKEDKQEKEKTGLPRPQGKLKCLGMSGLLDLTKARAVQAGKEKAARQAEIEKLAPEIAKLAAKDVNVKKELKIASELLGHKDIFSELETLERELSQIARERSSSGGSQKEVDPSKTGFFQKLKLAAEAAAAGIANTAKEAQLKLRESSATFKYEAASKQLALLLARELRERDFTNARLVPLTKKAAAAGVALEHWTAEETSALKEMERYAPLA